MRLLDALMFGVTLGGAYALVALGLNLQYGVARILNLAYGDVMIAAAFVGLLLFTRMGISPLFAAVLVVPIGLGFGAVLYKLAFVPLIQRAPTRGALESDTILSTFGLLFLLQGVVSQVFRGGVRRVGIERVLFVEQLRQQFPLLPLQFRPAFTQGQQHVFVGRLFDGTRQGACSQTARGVAPAIHGLLRDDFGAQRRTGGLRIDQHHFQRGGRRRGGRLALPLPGHEQTVQTGREQQRHAQMVASGGILS